MIITNSLGSNYTTEDIRRSLALLFHEPPAGTREKLTRKLAMMFGVPPTDVQLFYKGRFALFATLEQLGIGPGDEVIVQAFTCAVLPESIIKHGATPVYVDVEPRSLNLSLASIKNEVTKKTKAVILQHTLGYINPDNDAIVSWCSTRGITVIQDLAHAFGAPGLQKLLKVRPRQTGSDLLRRCPIVLSFSQDKVIDGISGGALVLLLLHKSTHDRELMSRKISGKLLLKYLWYPAVASVIRKTYRLGVGRLFHWLARFLDLLPSPLDAPDTTTVLLSALASLARTQLEKLPETLAHRRRIALIYNRSLKTNLKIVSHDEIRQGSNLRYPIWVNNRDELEECLKHHGFYLLDHWYDAPVSPSWHQASSSYRQGSCPNAEDLSRHIFNLPTHANINEKHAGQLVSLINRYAK